MYVQYPVGVVTNELNVSLIQGAGFAAGLQGQPLRRLSLEAMAATSLKPGHYVGVFSYRGHACEGIPVHIRKGDTTLLEGPRKELAHIEYVAALEVSRKTPDADIQYFERVIALDPDHVNAHLQLAAYALARNSASAAREHLSVVERVDPHNPHIARIRRLLARHQLRRKRSPDL